MDNGTWVFAFIPLPFLLLAAGVIAAIVVFGLAFAFNQIIRLVIDGTLAQIRSRKKIADQAAKSVERVP